MVWDVKVPGCLEQKLILPLKPSNQHRITIHNDHKLRQSTHINVPGVFRQFVLSFPDNLGLLKHKSGPPGFDFLMWTPGRTTVQKTNTNGSQHKEMFKLPFLGEHESRVRICFEKTFFCCCHGTPDESNIWRNLQLCNTSQHEQLTILQTNSCKIDRGRQTDTPAISGNINIVRCSKRAGLKW